MPERQVKVLILGDATSLQTALGKAEASTEAFGATSSASLGAHLQTVNTYTTSYGDALTAQESRYATAQLAANELKAAEHDAISEGNAVARLAGDLGDKGGAAVGRLSALGGVMGSGGALGLGMGAAIIGLGGLLFAGHAAMDNADQNEEAQNSLGQAFKTQGENLADYQGQIDAFIEKNKDYIGSEYDAKNSIANFTRAGFDWNTTQRLMNDALDLSAAKHISLSDATDVLIRARSGDARALRDLGIAMKDVEDPEKALAAAQDEVTKATDHQQTAVKNLTDWETIHSDRSKLTQGDLIHERDLKDKVKSTTDDLTTANGDLAGAQAAVKDKGDKFAATLDLLEPKIKGARDNTSDVHKKQSELNVEWQHFTDKIGPDLNTQLSHTEGDLALIVKDISDHYDDIKNFVDQWQRLSSLDFGNWEQAVGKWLAASHDQGPGAVGGRGGGRAPDAGTPPPSSQPAGPTHGQSGKQPMGNTYNTTIHVNGSADPNATARAVSRQLAAVIPS